MLTSTVRKEGQTGASIYIPSAVRKMVGIEPGDKVSIEVMGAQLIIKLVATAPPVEVVPR